jgi:hypothetical protein
MKVYENHKIRQTTSSFLNTNLSRGMESKQLILHNGSSLTSNATHGLLQSVWRCLIIQWRKRKKRQQDFEDSDQLYLRTN